MQTRKYFYHIKGLVWISEECTCGECGHTHTHESEVKCDEQVWAFNEDEALNAALERLLETHLEADGVDWDEMPDVTIVEEESESMYMARMGAPQLFTVGSAF